MAWKHLYGPVPSRRLGRSLGVNPIPSKTCNYSCVYCQLGRAKHSSNERQRFFPPDDIIGELEEALSIHGDRLDYVTFVGEGEPSLCSDLGSLIAAAKQLRPVPVAAVTNGSLLCRPDVRQELADCDVVMPSLDAADEHTFRRINRPNREVHLEEVVEGLREFRAAYSGKLLIEVMLVKGLNDQEAQLGRLRERLESLHPDEVSINVPVRPPAEAWVQVPDEESLRRAQELLQQAARIDRPEQGSFGTEGQETPLQAIEMIVRRHPMRLEQIGQTLGKPADEDLVATLATLVEVGKLRAVNYRGTVFYGAGDSAAPAGDGGDSVI